MNYYNRLNSLFSRIDNKDNLQKNKKIQEDTLHILVDKINKQFDIIGKTNRNEFFKTFEDQIRQRVTNLTIEESNNKIVININDLLNLLDDFKMEYEILMDRLFYLNDTGEQIENILYSRLETDFGIDLWNLDEENEKRVEELISEIKIDCVSRDFNSLSLDLKSIIDIVSQDIPYIKSGRLQMLIDNISYSLLRAVQVQERVSRQEMKSISFMIDKYLECYYMYTFILEYIRVMDSKNTKFFTIFKKGIGYSRERK